MNIIFKNNYTLIVEMYQLWDIKTKSTFIALKV